MPPPTILFVYGTLMRGEAAHARIAAARFLGDARTRPRYTLVELDGYPALLPEGTTRVQGELYEVEARLLDGLDEYESVPDLYVRRTIELEDGPGLEHVERIQGYLLAGAPPASARRLAGGDWRTR